MKRIAKQIFSLMLAVVFLITGLPVTEFSGIMHSQASAASSITEYQLYTQYPHYLIKGEFLNIFDRQKMDMYEYLNSGNTGFNAFLNVLTQSVDIAFTEIGSWLGFNGTTEEQICDKVIVGIVQELQNSNTMVVDAYNDIKSKYSVIKTVNDLDTKLQRASMARELAEVSHKSEDEIEKYLDALFEDREKVAEYCGNAMTLAEVAVRTLEIDDLASEVVQDLYTYFAYQGCDELADAAYRIYNKTTQNLAQRAISIYIEENFMDELVGLFADAFPPLATVKAIGKVLGGVGKILEKCHVMSNIDDIGGATYAGEASSLAINSVYTYVFAAQTRKLTTAEVSACKYAYNVAQAALVVALGYTESCAKERWQRIDAKAMKAFVKNSLSYDDYISSCTKLYNEAVENGEVVKTEYSVDSSTGVSSGTVTTPLTPEQSWENIESRFAKIQANYPPNQNVRYLDGGECFGFARMVFRNLFGVEMPCAYYGSAKYALAYDYNVSIVGQLTDAAVTVDNLAALFSKAKLGDVIQACGKDFQQHTMVFVDYSADKGLTLYDCNFRYGANEEKCVVHQRTYSLSEFAGWYDNVGTAYSDANGVTLYHANNYDYIYGGDTAIFYDDSVNFVITDGVLTAYNGWQRYVNIPDGVTAIGDNAFKNNDTMVSVSIPSGVTSIGASAFYDCDNLTAVVMPDTVTSLGSSCFYSCDDLGYVYLSEGIVDEFGSSAFANCPKLTDVVLPPNIKNIDNSAFYNCDSITEIFIPKTYEVFNGYYGTDVFAGCDNLRTATFEDGITVVPNTLFKECTGLETVVIPETVISITAGAFQDCINLKAVNLPACVTEIGSSAFSGCSELQSINFPNSITKIGQRAFQNCIKLPDFTLPENIKEIGAYAFYNCDSLTKMKFPSSLTTLGIDTPWVASGGSLVTKYYGAFTECDNLTTVEFAEDCTSVPDNALYYCTNLQNVILHNSITSIGNRAFTGCKKLEGITIPDSVTAINTSAFENCTKLSDVKLPKYLKTLGAAAFYNCDSLIEIEFPSTLKTFGYDYTATASGNIYYGAFSKCDNLTYIKFADSYKTIPDYAVYKCESVTKIDYPTTITSIGRSAFNGCTGMTSFTIPETVTSIGDSAFKQCTSITDIKIPDSVTSLGENIFYGCTSLTNVHMPVNCTVIPEYTFYDCVALKNVNLPNILEDIYGYAFYNCDSLESAILPAKVNYIGQYAYYDCDAITDVDISSVSYLGNYAYYDCDALEIVNIEGVKDIGAQAFYGCDVLSEITLGEYVNSIGASAFRKLPELTEISIPSPVVKISDYAFAENVKLTEVHIPSSVTTIADTAFSYPDRMTINAAEGSAAQTYAEDNGYTFVADDYDLSIIPTATKTLDTSVTVTWTPVTGITKYAVSYIDNNGVYTSVAKDITGSSYTITGLSPYKTYKILVRGYKNGRYSDYTLSDTLSVTTLSQPGKISTFTATPADNSVALSWSSSSGISGGGYILYQWNDATSKWVEITRHSTRSYTVNNLVSGTGYKFAVCGYKVVGDDIIKGALTEVETTTTGVKPVTKPVVTATAGAQQVELTWSAVTGATKYNVYSYLNSKYTLLTTTTATSYTATGLTAGTKYGFLVRAYVNGGWTAFTSADLVYATPTAPAVTKPVVTATAGAGQVALKWNTVSGATNYKVFTYLNNKYTELGTTTSTSYTATGLTGGTKYGFLVRAYVNGTWSAFTTADVVYATPTVPAVTKPVVTATAGTEQVKLTWTAVTGATNYKVFSYLNNAYKVLGETSSTSYTAAGLTAGTKYGFLVRAYVNGAWTTFTSDDVVYATPTAPAVTKPVVTATAGVQQVALKWNAVTGATKYNVYIYTTGYKLLATVTDTSYTATGLTGGTKYGFLVRAVVNGVQTAFTNDDLVYATPTAPAVTKPVVTATAGTQQVALKWNAVTGATKYNVYSYTTGYKLLATVTDTSYTATGLTAGTEYGFLVRAYVNGAWTAFTNDDLVYATPTAPAVTKPVVIATAGTQQVSLEWDAVTGATSYNVYIYTTGYELLTTTTATSYTATGLTAGTKYGFLVRALVNGTWTAFTNADLVYATPTAPAVTKPALTVTPMEGEALLRWNAVSGATNYRVFTYLNGKYTEIGTMTTTSCLVSDLTSGTEYGFLVRAYVNGAWTAFTSADVTYATIL